MASTTHTACPGRPGRQVQQRRAASRFGPFLRFLRRLPQAYTVHRERRALMALSDRSLKDLGISRADVYREATRPWWEIPDNR